MSKRIRTALTGAGVSLALSAVVLGGTAFAQSDLPTTPDALDLPLVTHFIGQGDGDGEASEGAYVTSHKIGDQETPPDGDAEFGTTEGLPDGHAEAAGFAFSMGAGPDGALNCHVDLATIADELGITVEEVQAEFEAGASLSDIITAHGSTVDEVIAALVAEAEADAQASVAAGEVTQEQADQFLADLPKHLTEILNDDFSLPALPAHPDAGGEDAAPDEPTAEESGTV